MNVPETATAVKDIVSHDEGKLMRKKHDKTTQLQLPISHAVLAPPAVHSLAAHAIAYAADVRTGVRCLKYQRISEYLTKAALEERLSSAMPPAAAFKEMVVRALHAARVDDKAGELTVSERPPTPKPQATLDLGFRMCAAGAPPLP